MKLPSDFMNKISDMMNPNRPMIRAILTTKIPVVTMLVEYEADTYIIFHYAAWLRFLNYLPEQAPNIFNSMDPLHITNLYGIPVYEDDELVKKIMLKNLQSIVVVSGE